MDRNTKIIKGIVAIVFIIVIIFMGKYFIHKREINKLLNVESVDKIYIQNINSASNKLNNQDMNKVNNYSENVTKKTLNGKDFVSEFSTNDSKDNQIQVFSNNENNVNFNEYEVDLLARLINSEAGNEPYSGKIAVGNVVLYRAEQNKTNIEEVIYSKNQFDGIHTDNFNRKPSEDSIKAAKEVLAGFKIIEDGYFFANLNLCDPSWAREKTFICRIGDHWFFKKE